MYLDNLQNSIEYQGHSQRSRWLESSLLVDST